MSKYLYKYINTHPSQYAVGSGDGSPEIDSKIIGMESRNQQHGILTSVE
jgi:hypothetical protein